MIVLDILLFCNLLLFAVCAFRSPSSRSTRIDDLVEQATGQRPAVVALPTRLEQAQARSDNVIRFPSPDELARRRGKAAHPPTGLRHHPSIG